MTPCAIFDFETISTNVHSGAIASVALLKFDLDRLLSLNPYSFEELYDLGIFAKFDIPEQLSTFERIADKSTMEWWKKQPIEVQRSQLQPSADDVSVTELRDIFVDYFSPLGKLKWVFTRGNTFDPVLLDSITEYFQQPRTFGEFWKIRDTRSFIDGLSFGSGINDKFIPKDIEDKIIPHDPRSDVTVDVMRIQFLLQQLIKAG